MEAIETTDNKQIKRRSIMRKLLLLYFNILVVYSAHAELNVSKSPDGTVTLTLQTAGDLNAEFTGTDGQAKASAKLTDALQAQHIKIITEHSARMSSDDMRRLCGENYGNYQHFSLNSLDLSEAQLSSESDLFDLGWLTSMKKITFPKNTTSIPNMTFLSNSKCQIEEIIIPDNTDIDLTIGEQGFHTNSLKSITFGARKNLTIGTLCCQGNQNLQTVDFRYGSTNIIIGKQAFDKCVKLENIVLPEGVTEIGEGAFLNSGITAIRLPNTLKTIRKKAFAGCSSLTMITIPENVERIETTAFENNFNLNDVYVLGTTTKCEEGAFTDNNTYQYELTAYTDDQKNVKISDYTIKGSNMRAHTVLHFKKEAYDNYVNDYVKQIGTSNFDKTKYGGEWNNHWVYDEKGNKLPVKDFGFFEGTQGDYAGWKNFMLSDSTLNTHIHEDDIHTGDKWYTLCLPFPMTHDQLKSTYGATVEVVKLQDVDISYQDGIKHITLKFTNPVTSTEAHHPYMIHPAIHKGTTNGVKLTIVGIAKEPETQDKLNAHKEMPISKGGVTYTFIGNYSDNKPLQPHCYYYYSGDDTSQWANAFYKWGAIAGGKWPKYTACVLTSKNDGAGTKASTIYYTLISNDDVITGIDNMISRNTQRPSAATVDKIYNLNGQVIRSGSTSLEGLPSGIYIINGRKYKVK